MCDSSFGNSNPQWFSYCSDGWLNHQPVWLFYNIYIYIYTYVYITYINIYIHISPHLNHVEVRRRQHCWAHPPTGHARARLPGNAFRWWIELDLLWLYPLRCGMDPLSPTSSPQKSLDTLYRTLTRPLRPPKWPLQASVYTSTVPVSFVILHVPPQHLRNIHIFFKEKVAT